MLEICNFRSSLLSKNMPRLRAPLVGTMIDPPTVRLGAANVVTQTHSVLSTFSLSLLDCIHPHLSSIQTENFRVKLVIEINLRIVGIAVIPQTMTPYDGADVFGVQDE